MSTEDDDWWDRVAFSRCRRMGAQIAMSRWSKHPPRDPMRRTFWAYAKLARVFIYLQKEREARALILSAMANKASDEADVTLGELMNQAKRTAIK
jgi:hypothetical protein